MTILHCENAGSKAFESNSLDRTNELNKTEDEILSSIWQEKCSSIVC